MITEKDRWNILWLWLAQATQRSKAHFLNDWRRLQVYARKNSNIFILDTCCTSSFQCALINDQPNAFFPSLRVNYVPVNFVPDKGCTRNIRVLRSFVITQHWHLMCNFLTMSHHFLSKSFIKYKHLNSSFLWLAIIGVIFWLKYQKCVYLTEKMHYFYLEREGKISWSIMPMSVFAQFPFTKYESELQYYHQRWMCELPRELKNGLRLRILGNLKISSKSLQSFELMASHLTTQKPNFESCAIKLPKICCETPKKHYFTCICKFAYNIFSML